MLLGTHTETHTHKAEAPNMKKVVLKRHFLQAGLFL